MSYQYGIQLGIPAAVGYSGTVALSAAATYAAYSFVSEGTDTLDGLWILTNARTGTDANISIAFDLRADNNGLPATTSLETHTKTGGWPTTNNTQTFVDVAWATTLTKGQRYWIVVRNVSSAPATDYLTIFHIQMTLTAVNGSPLQPWWTKYQSSDSGATWATATSNSTALALKYSSGLCIGTPFTQSSFSYTSLLAYGTTSVGVEFKSFTNLRVRGLVLGTRGLNSPSGPYYQDLYINRTLISSTEYLGYYSSASSMDAVVEIAPTDIYQGDTVAIMMRCPNGNASNALYLNQVWQSNDIPDLLAIRPWGNTIRVAQLIGGTWTTNLSQLYTPRFGVILDKDTPFPTAPLNRRNSMLMR